MVRHRATVPVDTNVILEAHRTRSWQVLAGAHAVGERDRAVLAIRAGENVLDRGEASLWAHASGRGDDWVLCGSDNASLRCGVWPGCHARLVSLEGLLHDAVHRPRTALREAYTRRWHERTLGELAMAERC